MNMQSGGGLQVVRGASVIPRPGRTPRDQDPGLTVCTPGFQGFGGPCSTWRTRRRPAASWPAPRALACLLGPAPDLVRGRGVVHVLNLSVIGIIGVLVEQRPNDAGLVWISEELLVGPKDRRIRCESFRHPGAQAKDTLHPGRWKVRVEVNIGACLADTVDSASSLDELHDRPREVKIHHDVAVLKVLALGKHVSRHQDSNLIFGCWSGSEVSVASGTEPPGDTGRIL